jgi:hypothetical protein
VPIFDGPLVVGAGSSLTFFGTPTTGQAVEIEYGTPAAPYTLGMPLEKISLTSAYVGSGSGTESDRMSALYVFHKAISPSNRQPIGGNFYAIQASDVGSGNNDAAPVRAFGQATRKATSTVYATTLIGSRYFAENAVSPLDIQIQNETGQSPDDVNANNLANESYDPSGGHQTRCGRFHSKGFRSACVWDFKRTGTGPPATTTQFDVCFGFPQGSGAVADNQHFASALWRSDCSCPYGIRMENPVDTTQGKAHATAALAVADGYDSAAGGATKVFNAFLLGTTTRAGAAQQNAIMVVQSSFGSASDAIIWLGSSTGTLAHLIRFGNGQGELGFGVAGAANDYIAGTVAGDVVFRPLTAGKALIFGNAAKVIAVTAADTLAFFGVTPVARAAALTQTYSSTNRTHQNLGSADLTGIASSTTGSALTEPDATYVQATWQLNMRRIQDQFVQLRADVTNIKRFVNSLVDDLQAYGLEQ